MKFSLLLAILLCGLSVYFLYLILQQLAFDARLTTFTKSRLLFKRRKTHNAPFGNLTNPSLLFVGPHTLLVLCRVWETSMESGVVQGPLIHDHSRLYACLLNTRSGEVTRDLGLVTLGAGVQTDEHVLPKEVLLHSSAVVGQKTYQVRATDPFGRAHSEDMYHVCNQPWAVNSGLEDPRLFYVPSDGHVWFTAASNVPAHDCKWTVTFARLSLLQPTSLLQVDYVKGARCDSDHSNAPCPLRTVPASAGGGTKWRHHKNWAVIDASRPHAVIFMTDVSPSLSLVQADLETGMVGAFAEHPLPIDPVWQASEPFMQSADAPVWRGSTGFVRVSRKPYDGGPGHLLLASIHSVTTSFLHNKSRAYVHSWLLLDAEPPYAPIAMSGLWRPSYHARLAFAFVSSLVVDPETGDFLIGYGYNDVDARVSVFPAQDVWTFIRSKNILLP